jgi:glycerol kinase
MSFILALDQGTTSSRSLVLDHEGRVRGVGQKEFPQHFPRDNWVEHDALDIWASQRTTMMEALADAQISAHDIAAIGITNQRETTLLWERATGKPVANAIVWQDRRAAAACEALKAQGRAELIAQKTGLVIDAYFSATKLAWLLDKVPDARAKAERGELAFGTVDSWLTWNLTQGEVHATDVSNASRTMLLNIHTGQWDDELLALFNIPRSVLPTVVPSSGVLGMAQLGDARVPIAALAGDQQAALFGQACYSPGMAKNTYGTGCFMLMNIGTQVKRSSQQLLCTVGWGLSSNNMRELHYALEGSVFNAGTVVQWLRDGLGIIETSADIEALAQSVNDTAGVMCVPTFNGLGAPHWDASARGLIIGLTRGTTKAHIARAAVESMAYQSAELLDAMQQDTGIALKELRVDGGATVNNTLMQFQADLLGVRVVRPQVRETTALGAAYLAGLAVGYWQDEADIAANWQLDRAFEPQMSADERSSRMGKWRDAVSRTRGWA